MEEKLAKLEKALNNFISDNLDSEDKEVILNSLRQNLFDLRREVIINSLSFYWQGCLGLANV